MPLTLTTELMVRIDPEAFLQILEVPLLSERGLQPTRPLVELERDYPVTRSRHQSRSSR